MFNGRRTLLTQTLLILTAAIFATAGAASAFASGQKGAAPQLVPNLVSLLAGNPQATSGGYIGDGVPGSAATLGGVSVLAVDSVGNVYFPDQTNAVIREVNAQTGLISTVAGEPPSGCSSVGICAHVNSGCADGVAAVGNPIGTSIHGIAVDAYGNVYFSDQNSGTISVVYRAGAQVAAFIKLENPTGVASAGGVLPGFVYHIAGTINLSNCAGTRTAAATANAPAIPANDGTLAFQSATFGTIGPISLDAAGNIWIGDYNPNGTIRVINTQATPQTIYGVTVQPGFIASVVNCSSLTQTCPPGYGSTPETLANTGVGGPAGGGVFNTLANNQGQYMNVDAFGNVYELSYKGATPSILLGVAYAGGAGNTALAGQINNSILADTTIAGLAGLKATEGDFYYLLQNITLRPSSIANDNVGNLYYQDNHYGEVYRVDLNAVPYGGDFLGISTAMYATNRSNPATASAPVFCYPVNSSTTTTAQVGYKTIDPWGDGCPAIYADGPGDTKKVNGFGSTITDGLGNLYTADTSHFLVRETSLANLFPATPVGQQVNPTTLAGQQTLDFHFDQSNLPVQSAPPPIVTTSSFAVAPGTTDFSINPISSNYVVQTSGGFSSGIVIGANTYEGASQTGITSDPVCGNTTSSVDASLDCMVNVIFSPTGSGLRQGRLTVTTANGSVYSFGLSGIGVGGQIAIDGGSPVPVGFSGLGNPGQVAVDGTMVYVADPANNRVVAIPPAGGTQTTIGTGLKAPMGVAVDAAGNVYIADTGNNRILKVAAITGAQTVIGNIVETSNPGTPASSGSSASLYPSYAFKAPEGLAVDVYGNVYVADTGNGNVVEIPVNLDLGGAIPLLQYPNAPKFVHPVAVALDASGTLYVADTGQITILKLPAGGGDLQNLPSTDITRFQTTAIANSPSGVAVDAAGNIYVSDSVANTVTLVPSGTGPAAAATVLNLPNLNLSGNAGGAGSFSGGSLALDQNGNLYVVDSGNSQVLFLNRQNPVVNFGSVAQDQPVSTINLKATNIGNASLSLQSPFQTAGSGNSAAFTSTDTCTGTLLVGTSCPINATFLPTATGSQSASFTLNGGSQTLQLIGIGLSPKVTITLATTSPAGGPVAGSPATITATLTQPNGSNQPSGTVLFSYTLNGVAQGSPTSAAVSGGTAQFQLPTLLEGRQYVVSATYQGDSQDSQTTATPLTIYIPGVPVTAVANSITFTYGQTPPAVTGTVTGILPADQSSVTYKFVTAATSTTPANVYPIQVVFSGGNYLNYGSPQVLTPTGGPATATENKAPLTVQANNVTTVYGAPDYAYTSTVTGAVNGDSFVYKYTPASTSVLNVGPYTLTPSVSGPKAGNYNVTVKSGNLVVTKAPVTVAVSSVAPTVLTSGLSSDPVFIQVSTAVSAGIGVPTGTVTLTDTFTPVINNAPGLGTPLAPVTIGPLTLTAGSASYTLTSQTPGIHSYTVTYSGDANFQGGSSSAPATVEVDSADFVVTSSASPLQIAPGVLPGGNNSISGESSSAPEQAYVTVSSVLNFTGTVYLGCQPQNPSYVTCTVSPAAVTVPAPSSGSTSASVQSIVSISTPATLPLGFFSNTTSQLRRPAFGFGSTTTLAVLPAGLLAFCLRRRRRLSKALWMILAGCVIGLGLNGCGSTTVAFFTPVPSGPQAVTIYACSVQSDCTTNDPVGHPLTGTPSGTGVIRSFTIPINIQ